MGADAAAGRSTSDGAVSYRDLVTDPRLLAILLASSAGLTATTVVSPALPAIAGAFGVSDARVGLVMSAFFVPVVVMVPVVGVMADIAGRRPMVLGGLALFGVGGLAIALVEDFTLVLALRAVQGVGFAGMTPLAMTVIGDLYSGPQGSAAQGFRVGVHGVVQVLAPAAGGVLADLAWNYPFVLYGVALPVLALVAWYLPETARHDVERDGALTDELREYWASIRTATVDRDLLLLVGGGFTMFLLKTAFVTFVPLYTVGTLGARATVAGLLISILGAVRLVVSPASGTVVARTSRKTALVASAVLAGVGLAFIPLVGSVGHLGLVVGVYSVGDALFTPVLNDAVTAQAADEHRGGVVSGLNVLKNGGSMVSPTLFGAVLALSNFGVLFGLAGAAGLVYAVVAATLFAPGGE